MVKGYPFLLVVHPHLSALAYLPEERRVELMVGLRRALAASGMEAGDSSADLLLFNYDHPLSALSALFEELEALKKRSDWLDEKSPLPLHYVLHLESKNEPAPSFRHPNSPLWDDLTPDTIYLSPSIKLQWESLQKDRPLPPHRLGEGIGALTTLSFAQTAALRRKRVFPHRTLLATIGNGPSCFYCGLRTHPPARCPAKQLAMESLSLPDAGYQQLPLFVRNFQAAFSKNKEMEALLGPGVELAQIRKNPPLQAFIAYFDLLAVYQPRYLSQVSFSIHSVWSGLNTKVGVKMENRNLQVGLDCLRVGQLDQARELLRAENQAMGGKQYCATVGLAFVALEQGRFEEMGHHLQIASSLASVEKEKIHIALLLARYHDLAGNLWKAEQALQSMANLYADCHEIVYRRIQTAVRRGQGARILKMISGLAEANRLYFICLLLDPALLPIEGLLDDLLTNQMRLAETRAEEAMAAAVKEYDRLGKWIDGEDEEYQQNIEALSKLQQQLERRAYFDLLDVGSKAKALRNSGPRLQESKLDDLNSRIDQVAVDWEKFQAYWQDYPYKSWWRQLDGRLREARRMLVDARGVAAESLNRGNKRLAAAQDKVKKFDLLKRRMERLRLLLDSVRIFAGRLLVAELAISALLLVLYPLITIGLADQLGAGMVEMVRSPVTQKKILFAANLLVAPAIAFAQTVRRVLPD